MATPKVRVWSDLLRFRCTGCGNCCKETIVMLTDTDVDRIVGGTGLAPRAFVRFFGESEVIMPKRHPFWICFARRRAAMGLRWGRDRCIFLDGADQCTVYEHRPMACREHPFTVKMSKTGAIEGLRLSNIVDCPHELDGHLTRRQLARVSRWNERESEAYQKRVRAWNRGARVARTRRAFMQFMGLEWNAGRPGIRTTVRPSRSVADPFG